MAIFKRPYDGFSPRQLLEHFHHRPHIRFRPQVDDEHLEKNLIDDVLDNAFTFNHERHCYPGGIDWLANPSRDIEWQILLHKCYYFVGLGLHFRRTGDIRYRDQWVCLTESWIAQVEPGFIASDVTGRRIQNWIFAFHYFVHTIPEPCIPSDFLMRFLDSLHRQLDYLRHHLTSARNHRTLELYTLFLAAVVFPEFRQAGEWLAFSVEALTENAQQDILPDGVHCELSTFYHHTVLKNFLAVKQLAVDNEIHFPAEFDLAIRRALQFSLWVHKPDGAIPSLSDGDTGCFHELLVQADKLYPDPRLRFVTTFGQSGQAPQQRSRGFAVGGYYILRSPWQSRDEHYTDGRYLIFDCGPLGAGNHGHLDLLNIEVAAHGRSLVVDPGRYTYDESGETNWRVRFRSTASHNTVQVDGKDQARYEYSPRNGKFRITGPHPVAEPREFVTTRHFDYLHGVARSHEYGAIHHRKVFFALDEYWLVCDYLEDDVEHDYCLRFHLSPEADGNIQVWTPGHGLFADSPNLLVVQTEVATRFRVDKGWFSPVYGSKHPIPVLRYDCHGRRALFQTLLFPYAQHAPRVVINPLPDGEGCSAFHCHLQRHGQVVNDYYFIAYGDKGGQWNYQDIGFRGRFGFLRLDSRGRPLHAFVLNGDRMDFAGRTMATTGEPS